MRRFTPFRWVAVLALALALAPARASAQEANTLSISGTFQMDQRNGNIGGDLAEVYANGAPHAWVLTLYGVSYSHDYLYQEWNDEQSYGFWEQFITHVHATSFDFEFIGPDSDVLNAVVGAQLTRGSLPDGAFLEIWNAEYFDSYFWWESGPYASWGLGLLPDDASAGVSFSCYGNYVWPLFSADENGYPVVEPQRVTAYASSIDDYRPGNSGGLVSYGDLVDIGSAVPPSSTLSIADGSVREGNKGTTWLNLTVTLSGFADDAVMVDYTTADGTALARSDYTATSGTLTFQPGETSRTISVSIKGDRKREPNETFSVQLLNAVGATISDGVATATILNDD
jgi:hypothetical protein